jgi:hypothetical protein
MRQTPALLVTSDACTPQDRHAPRVAACALALMLLPTSAAWAVDGDRQAPESPSEAASAQEVPWAMPNLQIQTWATLWDQDEDPVADAGGYGDPEADAGFTLRRARLGLSGGWRGVDYNLRFGTSVPYDAMSAAAPPVDLIDAWARFSVKSAGGTTRFSLGQQRVPFSREQQMSTNDLVFQETAVSTAWLTPNRDLGVLVTHDVQGFGVSAGLYNGNGDYAGNADNGMMAAARVEYSLGGDTYRTNASEDAFGIGAGYFYNHTVATDVHAGGIDFLGRIKGLTIQGEFALNLLQPDEAPTVLPPEVPENTLRMGAMAQISYYRDVGIGAIEPAVRFSWLDTATHLDDNGDVGNLQAGMSWREPIPFVDLGAGYVHRMELGGRDALNDTVRVWAGFRYPSRKFKPVDLVEAIRAIGDRPKKHHDNADAPPSPSPASAGTPAETPAETPAAPPEAPATPAAEPTPPTP